MKELPKNYTFNESEKKWQKFWQEKQIYKWNESEPRKNNFVVDTPPPTVSGQLHIGHVYSYTQTDFIVRFQRMKGKNIFYPMGFDDNGLPTERLVEKQKGIKAAGMDRQQFIEICKEVVAVEEEKFRLLFNNIALSVDWSLEYQTISPLSRQISQMSFLDLMNKGEIYRDEQPMLWDPVDRTALAQADIEDKEKTGVMNDIIFRTEKGEEIIIATTRPEMLPACAAVFYHPDDERYKHLQGQYAITPLFGARVPIIADDMVKPEKGTGLVMCCTFGDQMDIVWWKKHSLPLNIILDKAGRLELKTEDEIGQALNGQKVTEARAKIIEFLKEKGLVVKQTEFIQTVKCAERSGAPLEILTTPQWFVRTIKHKDALLKRANELNWHPKSMKIKLENWTNSIAWDWCISRQRYFGVPFPVWYSKRPGEEGKVLLATAEQLPVDPLKDLPLGYSREEVEPDYDVMDTWATSSVSPQLCSHAISENFAVDRARHDKLFPFDLRPQAHEIIRTWAFYTMLKAHMHQDSLPWKNIMISGWCLAEDRSKMSKSKGNVLVPEKLLEQYGSDVIRYWASTSKLGADTAYSEDIMKNGKRLVNKLWNAAKLVSQHFPILEQADKDSQLVDISSKLSNTIDKWLAQQLAELVAKVEEAMASYEYADAMHKIEEFFWFSFCDNYLEISKVRAYNENGLDNQGQYSAVLVLYHTMQILLKLFAPFMPHITEELYQLLYGTGESIHARSSWITLSAADSQSGQEIQGQVTSMLAILDLVRKAKAQESLSIKAPIELLQVQGAELAPDLIVDLKNVGSIKEIAFVDQFNAMAGNNAAAKIVVLEDDKLAVHVTFAAL